MYEIKEIELKNRSITKKRLVISFHDEKMLIVGEFLMTDASLMDGEVLTLFKSVLTGEKSSETFSGNRCYVIINRDHTVIEDLLDDYSYPTYVMDTNELYDLTKMWLKRLAQYD